MTEEEKEALIQYVKDRIYTNSDFEVSALDIQESIVEVIYEFYGSINQTVPDLQACLLYTSPSPRDRTRSRMPSSA